MNKKIPLSKSSLLESACDQFSKGLIWISGKCLSKKRKVELNGFLDEAEFHANAFDEAEHIMQSRNKIENAINATKEEIEALRQKNKYYESNLKDITNSLMSDDLESIAKILAEMGYIKLVKD